MADEGLHAPRHAPACPPGEVRVWRASLSANAERLSAWLNVLCPEERARAQLLRSGEHRSRFVAAHGQLREILGACLSTPPGRLEFRRTAGGKPEVGGACADAVEFSMSHSGGLALYAVARGRRVGVDVEHIRAGPSFMQIARRFYSPRECAELESLPADRRTGAFFRLWTRKEAHAKATGRGLSMPFEGLDEAPDEWGERTKQLQGSGNPR